MEERMKKIYIISALLCASQALFAQDKPEVMFTGTPWMVQGISKNDRWICGGRQYAEGYRYNTDTKQLEIIEPDPDLPDGTTSMEISSVMDDGTVLGSDDYGYAAIFRNAQTGWERLPVPSTDDSDGSASAQCCSSDGKYIVGFMSLNPVGDNPYHIQPILWTLGADGQYTVSNLPEPETDFLGEKFQFTSPREILEYGKRVVGPIVNRKGDAPMPIVWTRDDAGNWTYDEPFIKIKYNLERYKEILKEEPDYNAYITLKPGEKGYMAQVREFQNATAEWKYKLYSEGETGKDFSVTPTMSRNGRYIAGVGGDFTYSLTEDDKGQKSVTISGSTFPAYLDMQTGQYVELKEVPDFEVVGISDDADIITTDGYDIYLILANDQTHKISIADWLKKEYDMNLGDILPANLVTNKKPRISADGKLITGVYATQTDEGELDVQETYCIKLPHSVTAIMNTLDTPSDARIYVSGGQLSFSGTAANIHVFDMGGKEVLRHDAASSSIDITALANGVYVAKANISGKTVTSKFYFNK